MPEELSSRALALLFAKDRAYEADPWLFLSEQAVTVDEADQTIKPFPVEKQYLHELVDALQRERMLALPKSRRMLATWTVAAWATWRARYHPNNAIFIQSRNEDAAAFVVDSRCAWIETNLMDRAFQRRFAAHRTQGGKIGRIAYEATRSTIWAMPQGGDVLRSYTFSVLVLDESEFQEQGEEAVATAMAQVEKGAKIVLLSSSNGPRGPLARICKEIGLSRFSSVEPRRSPRGFLVRPIHFTLDPAKRQPEWERKERTKYATPAEFEREMNMDFTAQVGAPAYPNFRAELHLVEDLALVPSLPLCLAVDFNVSPMVWEVCQIVNGRVHVLDEIKLDPATIDECVIHFRNRYPAHAAELRIYGDATGKSRTAQTARSDYDLMKLALRNYSSPLVMRVPESNPLVRDRLNAVNRLLLADEGQSLVRINSKRCPELVQDLAECALRPDGKDLLKTYAKDDPYHERTHASDALGYLIVEEFSVSRAAIADFVQKTKPLPPLKYGRILGDFNRW